MMDLGSEQAIGALVRDLRLSDRALAGCRSSPEKAIPAILIGWQVVVENCLTSDEKWKLESSSPDETLLAELEEIYTTSCPNKLIRRALHSFYGADPQEWWEMKDVRALLDLAIRSALEATFAKWEELPEHR